MYGKGKSNSSAVPSDSQAREKLALYVYEYLLHVGAQKSAQTFLSEIRWEKNITLGEPPGFLHSWWCVFWDLYCAAPERRETCEHSSEAKAFHDYSAAAAPSPVLGNIPPGDGMPVGPVPPGFFQPFMSPRYPGGPRPPLRIPNQALGGVPGSQPLLPSGMDPTRQQGHPNMGGPMQRMTPPRGMVPLGPQNYGGAMRPPLNALGGPGMPGMNMGPGGGRPWPNATNANSIPYSSASPGNYVGPPGGGGPPGTPIMPSPADSTNSGDNMYTLMNAVPPGPNRPNNPSVTVAILYEHAIYASAILFIFPVDMEYSDNLTGLKLHVCFVLRDAAIDSIFETVQCKREIKIFNNALFSKSCLQNSPNNMSLSNQPGTPRDDGEMGGNFLNPFQSESYSPSMTMSV
ncbi:PREDICTED: single-stranded DNA-binding protein 2 [Hipposideros armiger]|uniref:Single-stranded DNA-binding protein 2 n=1 Tax=Hipposideros armiger TaxID=186990 RepID=A0A8B7S8R9_HIPAR|nr:PREDICTED: single-stranded DNA-binding protein 2 [Hipposideros armiger]